MKATLTSYVHGDITNSRVWDCQTVETTTNAAKGVIEHPISLNAINGRTCIHRGFTKNCSRRCVAGPANATAAAAAANKTIIINNNLHNTYGSWQNRALTDSRLAPRFGQWWSRRGLASRPRPESAPRWSTCCARSLSWRPHYRARTWSLEGKPASRVCVFLSVVLCCVVLRCVVLFFFAGVSVGWCRSLHDENKHKKCHGLRSDTKKCHDVWK